MSPRSAPADAPELAAEPPAAGTDTALALWYRAHGRHDLPWRAGRDRWLVLVSEVALQQTPVPRVHAAWPALARAFPDPAATARRGPDHAIRAWGTLGYPRRARRLWEAAVAITTSGWPDDLTALPGVGRYTAHAVRAQADGWDVVALDVNIRRVVDRVAGTVLAPRAADAAVADLAGPLTGRARLLALMDLGAQVCTRRAPSCPACPLRERCAGRGPLPGQDGRRPAPYEGSFRQRRGRVLGRLRAEASVPAAALDAAALASLVADGLAAVHHGRVSLPSA